MASSELKEILLTEMSRFMADRAAIYVGKDEEKFGELIDLMLNGKSPISQRAAWAMSIIAERDSYLLTPYKEDLIDRITSFEHPALSRFVMKYLCDNSIPENKFGQLLDLTYKYLLDMKTPIAVRVYAMQIIYNISCFEPDLKEELKLTLESLYESGSAGFQNRAGKLLKKLSKK